MNFSFFFFISDCKTELPTADHHLSMLLTGDSYVVTTPLTDCLNKIDIYGDNGDMKTLVVDGSLVESPILLADPMGNALDFISK